MADSSVVFDVALVGAGMAGLTCAALLHRAGYSVVVVEKSRGLGGRMTTRRFQGTCADFGARYLDPKGPLLRSLVQVLSDRQILQIWTDTFYEFNASDRCLTPAPTHWSPYYVAPAGMSAAGKFLATDLSVWRNRRVQAIAPTDGQIWHLTLEATDSNAQTPLEIAAKAVVMAIPAPQALTILEPPEMGLPLDFLDRLRYVEFEPCISVMVGYPAFRQRDLARRNPAWRAVTFPDDKQLAWIGWDSSKRSAAEYPVFVLHSTAAFAKSFLDAPDLLPAGHQLLARAAESLLPWLNEPEWMQVHRWRYAFSSQNLLETCLATATPLPLVCCGDWCGGDGIESALQSGIAAADRINRQLQKLNLLGDDLWEAIARDYGNS